MEPVEIVVGAPYCLGVPIPAMQMMLCFKNASGDLDGGLASLADEMAFGKSESPCCEPA